MTRFATANTPGSKVPGNPSFTFDERGMPRDRWNRPGIIPPGKVKMTGYTRCTTFIGVLDNKYNIHKSDLRWLAYALAQHHGWQEAVTEAWRLGDKGEIESIIDWVTTDAGQRDKTDWGTIMHALTEDVDAGRASMATLDYLASWDTEAVLSLNARQRRLLADNELLFRRDLDAYVDFVRERGVEFVHFEPMSVCDQYSVAGTPDRIAMIDGKLAIWDLKTGSVEYLLKMAMQLAMYAHSDLYDWPTDTRTPHGARTDVGYIMSVPAGTGTAALIPIDLDLGWRHVELSSMVRTAQSIRKTAIICK